jgi:hypothetical protein
MIWSTLACSRNGRGLLIRSRAASAQPKVQQAPQAGWELGLPDESGTPDHTHYWAIYKRFGLTIVYNSPSATDKGATIYAILVNK